MKLNDSISIVVVSDTHRDLEFLNKVILRESGANYFFHLGDSEIDAEKLRPFITIKGNRDYQFNYPVTRLIKLDFGNIFLIHHLNEIPLNKRVLEENNIKIVLFGHTHRRFLELIDGVYYANPGSLVYARDQNANSYLLIKYKYEDNSFEFVFKEIAF